MLPPRAKLPEPEQEEAMEKTTLADRNAIVVEGTPQILGHSTGNMQSTLFNVIEFEDGTRIRNVWCDNLLEPFIDFAPGRYAFIPWGGLNILVAVETDAYGIKVADDHTWHDIANGQFAQSLLYFVVGIITAVLFVGLPLIAMGIYLVIRGISLGSIGNRAMSLLPVDERNVAPV